MQIRKSPYILASDKKLKFLNYGCRVSYLQILTFPKSRWLHPKQKGEIK